MRLQLQVFGDTQFDREIRRVGKRATAARPLYDALGWKLVAIQREQFQSEGGRSGHPWAPLADSTVRSRGSAHPILDDTSALRESFLYGGAGNIFEATDDHLRYGSESEIGIFHQQGTSRMPMRKPMELTDEDRDDIVKDMQHWVIRGSVRF